MLTSNNAQPSRGWRDTTARPPAAASPFACVPRRRYALGAVLLGSLRSSQAVVREATTVHEGQQGAQHCRGRLSAWHRVAPTACTTDATEGISRHRKEQYGTLQSPPVTYLGPCRYCCADGGEPGGSAGSHPRLRRPC